MQTTSKRASGRTLRTPEHRRTLEQKRDNTVLQRDWTHADSHKKLPAAKHIFSHIEWQMIGYDIRVDELEKTNNKKYLFIHPEEIQKEYPIPSAFEKYMKLI